MKKMIPEVIVTKKDLKKEISEYIKLSVHEQNVLEFSHQNQHVFPILYCISTMILCAPATSVPR